SDDAVFVFGIQRIKVYHLLVTVSTEVARYVINPGDTTAHTSSKVTACFAQDQRTSSGHVFTTVVTDTFHDGRSSGVSYRKTFACHAVDKEMTGCCAIQCNVTDDDILMCYQRTVICRVNSKLCARKPLTHIVIGFTFQFKRKSFHAKCPKRLAG